MGACGLGDEGEGVGCFVQAAEFAETAVGEKAGWGVGKGDEEQGGPEVFAQAGGDGLFAEEGELAEGGVVLLGDW